MHGYQIDWIGALSAGVAAGFVIFLIRKAFPRLSGARFYVV